MPTQRAIEFVQKLQGDKGLQARLGAIEADTREDMVNEMARLASEAGFPLTNDEVAATVKDESEVADAQLEHVVGGVTNFASLKTVPLETKSEEEPSGVTPGHAYTVTGTTEVDGTTYVIMRNPWGSG